MRCFALALLFAGCATVSERLHYEKVHSPAMRRTMEYGVYTPPGFRKEEHLPLVLFLHGGGDTAHCLDQEGVARWLDQEIVALRVPRVVVVVPQGDTGMWANWADGTANYADWALEEVFPRVAKEYQTRECPLGCHLLGISMGGAGALRMLLEQPGRFSSVSVISGPTFNAQQMDELMQNFWWKNFARLDRVFGPDPMRRDRADPFLQLTAPDDLKGSTLYLAHGDADRQGIGGTNAALHRHLEAMGIPHRYTVFHGGHRWKDWLPVLREALGAARLSSFERSK
jgi:enterochelin esterase-like enzyme